MHVYVSVYVYVFVFVYCMSSIMLCIPTWITVVYSMVYREEMCTYKNLIRSSLLHAVLYSTMIIPFLKNAI